MLKDASAAIYGVKGGNGVVLITTKKGDKGRVNINYSGNISWQRPSNFPDLVDAADWMTLYNEKYTMHSVDNMSPVPQYSQEDIAAYRNGEKKSYNWKDAVFRNSAPQTQHTVSASGGNDKVTFYTSLGYQYQESFLQHTPITYDKYTLRANINAKIAKNLTLDVNLAGHMDEKKMSNFSSSDIVRSTWLFTPLDPFYYDDEQTMYHTKDDNTGIVNPLAMIDQGRQRIPEPDQPLVPVCLLAALGHAVPAGTVCQGLLQLRLHHERQQVLQKGVQYLYLHRSRDQFPEGGRTRLFRAAQLLRQGTSPVARAGGL